MWAQNYLTIALQLDSDEKEITFRRKHAKSSQRRPMKQRRTANAFLQGPYELSNPASQIPDSRIT